jgi:hypothetical protein
MLIDGREDCLPCNVIKDVRQVVLLYHQSGQCSQPRAYQGEKKKKKL